MASSHPDSFKDKDKLVEYKKELTTLKEAAKISARKIESLSDDNKQLRLHAEREAKERKVSQQTAVQLSKELRALRDELKTKEQQIQKQDRTLTEAKKQIRSTHSSALRSASRLDNTNDALTKRLVALQKENELLNGRAQKVEKRFNQLTKQYEEEKDIYKSNNQKTRASLEEVKRLKKEIELLKKSKSKPEEIKLSARAAPDITSPSHKGSTVFTSPALSKLTTPISKSKTIIDLRAVVVSEKKTPSTPVSEKKSLGSDKKSLTPLSSPRKRGSAPMIETKKDDKLSVTSVLKSKRASVQDTPITSRANTISKTPLTVIKPRASIQSVNSSRTESASKTTIAAKSLSPASTGGVVTSVQLTKLRQELTQKFQAELISKDKLIAQMRAKIKSDSLGCSNKEHNSLKNKIESMEMDLNKKDINLLHQQNQISELEASHQHFGEKEANYRIQINELDQKLKACPNPDKVEQMSSRIEDLQKQVIEYQNKYEQSLKRRHMNVKEDSFSSQKAQSLLKKIAEMEFSLMYGDTAKDKEIQILKKARKDDMTLREMEKNKISEREVRLKGQIRKYQQAAEWLYEDGDIAVF